jgi:F-box/leucine-rich repeat protein 2/20
VLDFSGCPQVTNTVVRSILQGCTRLQRLVLNRCPQVTDAAFQHDLSPFCPLRACLTIRSISFVHCPQVSEVLVGVLIKTCHSLTDLNFSHCKRILNPTVHLLESVNDLQKLNLSFAENISDAAFMTPCHNAAAPAGMGAVEPHWYSSDLQPDSQISQLHSLPCSIPAGAEALAPSTRCLKLHALQELNLGKCSITDVALFTIATNCGGLESVKLCWCVRITDSGVQALASGCPRLRRLDLKNCGLLTDESVKKLGEQCAELRSLDVSWCTQLTDESVKGVSDGCSNLEEISMVWCDQLTDESIAALSTKCPSLKSVQLNGCARMTDEGIAKLRKSCQYVDLR